MALGPGCRADQWGKCVEHGSAVRAPVSDTFSQTHSVQHEKNDEDFQELQRRPKVSQTPEQQVKDDEGASDKEHAAIQALLDRDGGGLGFEFEDGKPDSGMRKGVKREMFRLI